MQKEILKVIQWNWIPKELRYKRLEKEIWRLIKAKGPPRQTKLLSQVKNGS